MRSGEFVHPVISQCHKQEPPLNHRKRQIRTRHLWFNHWNAPQGRLTEPTPPEPAIPHSSR